MATLVIGNSASYDGSTSNAATIASALGSQFASASSGALTLNRGIGFDNSTSTLTVTRKGSTSIGATGGATVSTNTEGPLEISSGGLFGTVVTINSGVYLYSDDASEPALKLNIAATVNNSGIIMGKGGKGGDGARLGASYYDGAAGGPAIEIASSVSGVTITNNSGAYIYGGGGGGGGGLGSGSNADCGGGGGAGGGQGGSPNLRGAGNGAAGGSAGSTGSNGNGVRYGPGGNGGGGGGGYEWGNRQDGGGGAGGRVIGGGDVRNTCANPGWNGTGSCYVCAYGRGGTNAGQDTTDGGMGGGGGGYGAAGGRGGRNGDTSSKTVFSAAGAAGKAIEDNGNSYTLTNNGSIAGAT